MPRIQPPPEASEESPVDAPGAAAAAARAAAPVRAPASGRPVRLSWGPGGVGGLTPQQVAAYAGAALGVLLLVGVTVAALGRRAPAVAPPAAPTPAAAAAPAPGAEA